VQSGYVFRGESEAGVWLGLGPREIVEGDTSTAPWQENRAAGWGADALGVGFGQGYINDAFFLLTHLRQRYIIQSLDRPSAARNPNAMKLILLGVQSKVANSWPLTWIVQGASRSRGFSSCSLLFPA